jgi:pimeloyl-ACP methyl ester carboxylesterase
MQKNGKDYLRRKNASMQFKNSGKSTVTALMKLLIIGKLLAVLVLTLVATPVWAADCVILLHGLVRTSSSLDAMADRLKKEGYFVVNHDYPSRKSGVATLATTEIPAALAKCTAEGKIHFVTHSLGGIIERYYLHEHVIPRLGRTVMLGPPNNGSQVVDALRSVPGFAFINGPAGLQLGTDKNSVPTNMGPVQFELGVIAGTRSINLILSNFLPNPDDGKVSVASTKVAGMKDHITVPVSHPFLMRDEGVINQVVYFLANGHFLREKSAESN